ncbi:RNA exonuclease 1 homolog [Nephila pilipes]|uniref:RNA exonuclease 1 homolog n=1 Tax=Nephila pilipes TaxID=299642 RepID=A0A8X6N6B2_NEPPI|nr:RNA exonuclease 1 homolog [Nephila pilipes]
MKSLNENFYSVVSLKSEELYKRFARHKMSYEMMLKNSFPLPDKDDPDKIVLSENVFSQAANQPTQICRCGKTLNVLEDNWYIDEGGCNYHLGKMIFTGPERGVYSCCKTCSRGCAFNEHHVISRRPFDSRNFRRPEDTKTEKNNQAANIFSIDCEMAFTTKGLEVVKVSLTSVGGDVIFDSYVQPNNDILDYNTAFSGVREENLRGVAITLREVQNRLLQLLNKNSILVGHGVENDLRALNIVHENVIDTSCVFPHERGSHLKHSLKYLAEVYLQKVIHDGFNGHDSVEDAQTCMELMLWKIYSETRSFKTNPMVIKTVSTGHSSNYVLMPQIPTELAPPPAFFIPSFAFINVTMVQPVIPFLVPTMSITSNFNPRMPQQQWWPRNM